MALAKIRITSYNIHKGMSALNREVQITTMAETLKSLHTDILFLQEVQGYHSRKIEHNKNFPKDPHDKIIAHTLNYYYSYGKNAIFRSKHHGNAILSRTKIYTHENIDISTNQFEQRGMLHCSIQPTGWDRKIECFCAHLNLREQDRQKQYTRIAHYFERHLDPDSPVILAGDFNDWACKAQHALRSLGLKEAFLSFQGYNPNTFPSKKPLLSLDRIFVRHLKIEAAQVQNDPIWQQLSDHLPISALLSPEVSLYDLDNFIYR